MKITQTKMPCRGIKFARHWGRKEIGRAILYIMHNDLHEEPFGLLEDVFVDPKHRGKGIGTQLVNEVIERAKKENCYKLIATSRHSRPKVHQLYQRIGFKDQGLEFRINF